MNTTNKSSLKSNSISIVCLFSIMFSSYAWSTDSSKDLVDVIMSPEPGLEIPLPFRMNRGINDINLLIKIRDLEKTNNMKPIIYKKLHDLAIEKINLFITQMEKEKAPMYDQRRQNLIKSYKAEIEKKFKNCTLSINTLILLGIKLCYFADFCRINIIQHPNALEDFMKLNDINLHNLFSTKAIKNFRAENGASPLMSYGFIATRPFEQLENHLGTLPIIPFISENAVFGVNTYLYALAKGYVILGFPVNNTSGAHQGMTSSFHSVCEFFKITMPSVEKYLPGYLTYNSSLIGLEHDLTHLQNIRNLINPTLQYIECCQRYNKALPEYDNTAAIENAKMVISGYRNIYLELLKEWHHLEKPETIALLIYWLLHESSYGEKKGANNDAGKLINASLTADTRREMIINDYQLMKISPEKRELAINRALIVNEFDFADQLNKWDFAIEINNDNPFVTLEAMRKVFINAYNQSPRIKQILNEMNQNQVYFYGFPIQIWEFLSAR